MVLRWIVLAAEADAAISISNLRMNESAISNETMPFIIEYQKFSAKQMQLMKDKNAAEIRQIDANTAKTVAETQILAETVPHSAVNAANQSRKLKLEVDKLAAEADAAISISNLRMNESAISNETMPFIIEYQKLVTEMMKLDMTEKAAREAILRENPKLKWLDFAAQTLGIAEKGAGTLRDLKR